MTTKIEWTDETWNPVVGCSPVSPGCDNCYAARDAAGRLKNTPAYEGLAVRGTGEAARFTGEVRLLPDRLDRPLRWRRPRRVFVNSTSDLFHPDVPDDFIADVFARMALSPRHAYQVLTKRPQRMAKLLAGDFPAQVAEAATDVIARTGPSKERHLQCHDWRPYEVPHDHEGDTVWCPPRWPLPNVSLGVSVEDPAYLFRLDHLRSTDAAIRFISFEPLVADVGTVDLSGIHWVIAGGESGPHARPMHPGWARSLRDQCEAAGVPFFFKQWGEWAPGATIEDRRVQWVESAPGSNRYAAMARCGKAAAGRELDGRTHDGYPAAPQPAGVPS